MENLFAFRSIQKMYCSLSILLFFQYATATTAINEYGVMGGDDVKLVYKSNGSVGIYRVEDSNHIIVRNGSLEGNPMIYDDWFTVSQSGWNPTLVIKNISRNEAGEYNILQLTPSDLQSFTVVVNYIPSKPVCSSSQKLSFFTDDVIKNTVVLWCNISDVRRQDPNFFIHFSKKFTVNTTFSKSENIFEKMISFVPPEHFNNTKISCIVRQEVSSSMNITLFEEFCSFPPSVYMEELQVMITPSVNTMTDSGNITFTCSSNAGPLNNVTWKITLEFPKSSISLLVNCDRLIFGLDTPIHIDNTSIYAECLGVIRSQSADAKAVLFLQAYILGSQMDLISYLYFAFFFALVVVVLCLMIYCCYETKKSLINSQNQYTLNVSGNEHQPNESPEHYQQITYKEKEDEEHIEIPGDLQFIYDKECYLVPSQNIATDTQHVVMN